MNLRIWCENSGNLGVVKVVSGCGEMDKKNLRKVQLSKDYLRK